MAFDQSPAGRIHDALARTKGIGEKKMFGVVGFLPHGNMLVGVWKDSHVARLGPVEGEALREPHVEAFDITGGATKDRVLVGPEGVRDDDQLTGWIERATRFVRTLPPKEEQSCPGCDSPSNRSASPATTPSGFSTRRRQPIGFGSLRAGSATSPGRRATSPSPSTACVRPGTSRSRRSTGRPATWRGTGPTPYSIGAAKRGG